MEIPLSLVLATYNEAANIKGCLESMRGLAGEIIVVDGSSTDQTREISKKLGASRFFITINSWQ
ncbi:MAG: Glycosyltransferase [Candidatus Beckwithbacteria bacterium GW2011_GWC2_47_9]|uniref:Glycosyltransferase n=1 Tax=Candidatus Beckwithbacteria bacterium GW2011_GWC2_47_9 TaxID=1618373 RepID=A0A0G1U0S4_9BACT|nr:MAG: Glycosyltransferase [Candidatus Beckwithbacteria bacterium GW2011_GWC2_47_9]